MRGRWGIAGQPVVLSHRQHVTAAVRPERSQVDAIRIERLGPAECLPIGQIVDIQEPACRGHVFVVARIVHQHGADPHRLEAAHAQCLKHEIVFSGRSQHLVIGGTPLGANEPVAYRTKQIPSREGLQVIVGLQRLAGSEIVVVVVFDQPERSNQHEAMVIGARGCPYKRAEDL